MPHDRSSDHEETGIESHISDNPSSADGETTPTRRVNRRDCLRLGTATALAAAGLTTSASAATTRYDISFSNVVDATDFGADPTGSADSAGAIEDAIDEGTLVVFPPGEYKIGSTITTWHDRFGLYGDGDVRFVPTDGFNDKLVSAGPDEFLFEDIDIDIRANNTVAGLGIRANSRMVIQNVEFLGRGTHSDSDVTDAFTVRINDSDGVGIIRNVTAKKGSAIGRYKAGDGRVGVFCGPGSDGTLRIENCHFEEFGNNGLYCSRTPGDVKVRDSYFRNNNVASVRISGDGSFVKNSTIEIDMSAYTGPTDSTGSAFNTRAIWFEQAQGRFNFPAGVLVEGCEINVRDAWQSSGAIVAQDSAKTVDVRDTVIRVESDGVQAVNRISPSRANSAVRLDNVSIVGDADGGESVLIYEADDSTVTNSCIYAPGDRRTAIRVVNANNCSVTDTNLSASDERIDEQNCSVSTSSLTNRDSCPISGDAQNDLLIESVGSQDWAAYEVTVSDDIWKGDRANSGDEVNGSTVSGGVTGGSDTYGFTGEVTEATVTDGDPQDIEISVNGNPIDLTGSLDRTIEIESVGSEDQARYEFTVSGGLEKGEYANGGDEVDGSTATGGVAGGGHDTYNFGGDVSDFTVTEGDPNDLTVYVDGEETSLVDSAENTIEIESVGSEDGVRYEFTVSGDLEKGEYANGSSDDQIDGSTATGGVGGGGHDTYKFGGEVTEFTITDGDSDDLAVSVNGEQTSLATSNSHTIEIESVGSEDGVRYEFTVSGGLEKGEYANGPSNDQVDGSTATGGVGGGGHDTYKFGGEVTEFTITDGDPADLAVSVDGEQTSLATSDSHTIEIESVGSEDGVRYEFTVSGYLEKGEYANGPSNDQVDGSTATGGVGGGGTDTYKFSGEVTEFSITDGDPADLAVSVDGEQTSLATSDSHTIEIKSVGSEDGVRYEFTVSGYLEKGEYANGPSNDQIDGSTATGGVGGGGTDTYKFSGEVTEFSITDGDSDDVAVYIDQSQLI